MDERSRQLLTLGLLVWAVATTFLRLGSGPVYIANEAREGVYVRAMLDTGDWVLPQVPNHVENGEVIPDKPPLLHWMAASVAWIRTALATGSIPTGSEVSRRFDEWSLRFPSAVCGVLMLLGVALRGRRIIGDRAGLLAAASLVMSQQYIEQSQYGRVDMTMAAFVTLSMLLLGEALLDRSNRALLAASGMSGLAVLAKGPIGAVLPALVGAAWIAIESTRCRSLRWASGLPWLSAVAVWAMVVSPWYLAAYAHGGMAFVRSQLLNENFHQYTGGNGAMPWWYYIRPWLLHSFPWNILGVLGVVLAWKARDRRALFCATWWLVFLAFFQASAYKRAAYLLPALPAGALLCGYFLDATLPSAHEQCHDLAARWRARAWKPALAVGIASAAIGAYLTSWPKVVARIGMRPRARDGAVCVLGAVIAIAAAVRLVRAVRARQSWMALASLWLCEAGIFHGVIGTRSIVVARHASPEPLIQHMLSEVPAGEILTVRGLRNDATLPLLVHFPDSARIVVVPHGRPRPADFAPGYYLFARKEWDAIESAKRDGPDAWRVLWRDDLRQRGIPAPVVFVERRA